VSGGRGREKSGPASGGYALVGVVFFAVVGFGLLAAGYERIHQATALARESTSTAPAGASDALGLGLSLLQTGAPPATPFACLLVVGERDAIAAFRVTYTRLGPSECGSPGGACWSVEAALWTGGVTVESACPDNFSNACGGGS
jgi:hypothetical protein